METSLRSTPEGNRQKLALVVDGVEVARLTIEDREMRLGSTWLRMGGVASVRVSPAHRGRGYGRRLMEDAVAYMCREGYLVSILFGIPGFYHRIGYATVLPAKSLIRVRTQAAEALGELLPVREAGQADSKALLAIYNEETRGRSGAAKRSESAFLPWRDATEEWFQEPSRILVAEENGKPVAYALGEHGWRSASMWYTRPYEFVAPGITAATAGSSLIRALATEAVRQRAEWIDLEMPPDAPMLAVLRSIGFRQEIEYSHNQGGMGRIVNLDGLAVALKETLEERVRTSGLEGSVGKVAVVCDAERAEMEIGAGRTITINLPQENLLQLLMGYRSLGELRLEFPSCVAEQDVAIIDILFPGGHPYMWNLDHF